MIPDIGVDMGGWAGAAIQATGAVVAVVAGGLFAFLLVRRAFEWAAANLDGAEMSRRDWIEGEIHRVRVSAIHDGRDPDKAEEDWYFAEPNSEQGNGGPGYTNAYYSMDDENRKWAREQYWK